MGRLRTGVAEVRIKGDQVSIRGYCVWCGEVLQADTVDKNLCEPCEKHRSWVLRMIRRNDRIDRYVASTRQRLEQQERQAPPSEPEPPTPDTSRLDRLEAMVAKLIGALT